MKTWTPVSLLECADGQVPLLNFVVPYTGIRLSGKGPPQSYGVGFLAKRVSTRSSAACKVLLSLFSLDPLTWHRHIISMGPATFDICF